MGVYFAAVSDLEEAWRPLTDPEKARAQKLIEYASRKVRRVAPMIDAKIADGSADELDAQMVVVGMVKRALTSVDFDGVTQASETVGGVSESRSYGNPMGNLYLTAQDLRDLGVASNGPRMIRLVPSARYDDPIPPRTAALQPDVWRPLGSTR